MSKLSLLGLLEDAREVSHGQWLASCPAHADDKPSLSVAVRGDRILLHCQAGCRTEEVIRCLGLTMADLFLDGPSKERQIVATFDYRDEQGQLLYQTVRFEPKDFRARRPDGNGGWIWNLSGSRRVLYHLPELIGADPAQPVFIPEGEKHVDRLLSLGFVATTSPLGAGKWRSEYSSFLRGRSCVILPDNDEPGRKHGETVAKSLAGIAGPVRVLALDGLPEKGDVIDWLDAGHTADELRSLAEKAHPYLVPGPDSGITAAQLLALDLPEPCWVVDRVLPEGLTLLCGKPKRGKSWLCLGIALAVARGECALGTLGTARGRVLYLALEDSRRRVRQRLADLLGGSPPPDDLHFHTTWERLDEGGLDRLRHWIRENPDARLLVIDTLARVRGPAKGGSSAYELDYGALAGLQSLAGESQGLSIVVVHHLRKAGSDDPMDLISGTTGLSGCADTLLILQRQGRGQMDAELFVTGRDVEEQALALRWEPTAKRWLLLGEAEKYRMSEQRQRIAETLCKAGTDMTPKAIAEAMGASHDSVKHLVGRMVEEGQLHRTGNGHYTLHPPHSTPPHHSVHPVHPAHSATVTGSERGRSPYLAQTGTLESPHGERGEWERKVNPECLPAGAVVSVSVAAERTQLHLTHATCRPLSQDYDLVGLAGEAAFATEFGLSVDATPRPSGDGGIDFTTTAGTVDVKTYRKPYHLLREVGRQHADILVLASFCDATGEARLVGWEYDDAMVQCPTRDFGYGIVSHFKSASDLRPIHDLGNLIQGASEPERQREESIQNVQE